MKNKLFYITIFVIGLITLSCEGLIFGGISFYNDFKVENKLDTTITIQLISDNEELTDLFYIIPINTTKSIVFSSFGNGDGDSPDQYDTIIVNYKNHILKDTIIEGNSLRDLRAYKELEKSTYKKKDLNTFVFTIDSTYIKDLLKDL